MPAVSTLDWARKLEVSKNSVTQAIRRCWEMMAELIIQDKTLRQRTVENKLETQAKMMEVNRDDFFLHR